MLITKKGVNRHGIVIFVHSELSVQVHTFLFYFFTEQGWFSYVVCIIDHYYCTYIHMQSKQHNSLFVLLSVGADVPPGIRVDFICWSHSWWNSQKSRGTDWGKYDAKRYFIFYNIINIVYFICIAFQILCNKTTWRWKSNLTLWCSGKKMSWKSTSPINKSSPKLRST